MCYDYSQVLIVWESLWVCWTIYSLSLLLDLFLHSLLRLRAPTLRRGGGAMGRNLLSGPRKWLHLVLSGEFAWDISLVPPGGIAHLQPFPLQLGSLSSVGCLLRKLEVSPVSPHWTEVAQLVLNAGLPPAWGPHLAGAIPPRTVGLWFSCHPHISGSTSCSYTRTRPFLWACYRRPPVEPFFWIEVPTRGGGNALHPY